MELCHLCNVQHSFASLDITVLASAGEVLLNVTILASSGLADWNLLA